MTITPGDVPIVDVTVRAGHEDYHTLRAEDGEPLLAESGDPLSAESFDLCLGGMIVGVSSTANYLLTDTMPQAGTEFYRPLRAEDGEPLLAEDRGELGSEHVDIAMGGNITDVTASGEAI